MQPTNPEKSMKNLAKSTAEVLDLDDSQKSVLSSAFTIAYSLGMSQNAQRVTEQLQKQQERLEDYHED